LSGTSGQVTLAAGQSSASITMHSAQVGGKKKKKVNLMLQSGSGYKVAKPKKATVTITP